MYVLPHPIIQGFIYTSDLAGTHTAPITMLNPQWTSAGTYSEAYANFMAAVSRYRLMYMSATGYHDSAATANEGTIAVAQYTQTPLYFSTTSKLGAGVPGDDDAVLNVEGWPESVRTYAQMQTMPGAYFGAARDGIYAPYKLSRGFKQWCSATEKFAHMTTSACSARYGVGTTYQAIRASLPTGAGNANFPYGFTTVWRDGNNATGSVVHKRADNGVIHISGANLDLTSNFTFYIRQGWEFEVLPASPYAAFQKVSPPLDTLALTTYGAIARELKDAYPAEFNDLGKILKEIANIALDVVPALIPSLSPFALVGKGIMSRFNTPGASTSAASNMPSHSPTVAPQGGGMASLSRKNAQVKQRGKRQMTRGQYKMHTIGPLMANGRFKSKKK